MTEGGEKKIVFCVCSALVGRRERELLIVSQWCARAQYALAQGYVNDAEEAELRARGSKVVEKEFLHPLSASASCCLARACASPAMGVRVTG